MDTTDGPARVVAEAVARFGGLDGGVSNAGINRRGRAKETGQIFAEPREPYTRALIAAAFDLEAVDADVVRS